MLDVKQNKPQSVKTTLFRLRAFFPDQQMTLQDVTPKYAAATYMNTAKAQATDTHRSQLAEVKTFFRWCVKGKKWLKENPIKEIEGVGKRKHGKPQLRIDEARRWLAAANELAGQWDEGAIGAMATLLLGLRAGEVVSRGVRDLDDGGRLLWIPSSKTEAGRRTLEVPRAAATASFGPDGGEAAYSTTVRAALAGLATQAGGPNLQAGSGAASLRALDARAARHAGHPSRYDPICGSRQLGP